MKKRWLAMLIVGCMLIGSMGMTAMAENGTMGAGNGGAAGEENGALTGQGNEAEPADLSGNEGSVTNDKNVKDETTGATFVIDENNVLIKYDAYAQDVIEKIRNSEEVNIVIPDYVTGIGDGAFQGPLMEAKKLTIKFPSSLVTIGDYPFTDLSRMTESELELPKGVTSIGKEAFMGWSNLKKVTLPDGITYIGDWAFYDTGLTEINIPGSVKEFRGAFEGISSLRSVIIQEGVTDIGGMTFNECKNLTSVSIPPSVTNIGQQAFGLCYGLTRIDLPVSITSIAKVAFGGCGNLKDIYYAGTKQQWEQISIAEDAFVSIKDLTVHCTDGDIVIASSQTTPETPPETSQPEENKPAAPGESNPAPSESKNNSGGSSSHSSGSSSQNNKPASAPAPSEPKTEQEAVRETIENLPQGGQAVLETSSVIGSGELRKIMEKGGSMVVFSPQVSWHFDVLTNGDMDFNPGIEVGADIPDLVQKLNGHSATPIRFAHNGVLPGAAHVGIAVSYAPGTRLYFYYYNRSTGLFEFQQSVTVENGGYVVVNLTHCSDYILTEQPLSGNTANGTVPAAGAGTGAKGTGQGNLDSTPHTGI